MDAFERIFENMHDIYHLSNPHEAFVAIQQVTDSIYGLYADDIISRNEYEALFNLGFVLYERIKTRTKEEP